MSPKKVGVKGKALSSRSRELVNNVRKFMKAEAESGLVCPLENYRYVFYFIFLSYRATYTY